MPLQQSRKVWMWLSLIGLVIIPLSLLLMWKKFLTWIALGKYSRLYRLVYAQAMHESDSGNSWLARNYHNYFGMKTAVHRYQLGKPPILGANPYHTYNSFFQSVRDFKLWLDYNRFPDREMMPFEYAKELKNRKYYEDTLSNYLAGIQRFL